MTNAVIQDIAYAISKKFSLNSVEVNMKDEKQNQLSTKATAFSIDAIIGNQSPHLAHGEQQPEYHVSHSDNHCKEKEVKIPIAGSKDAIAKRKISDLTNIFALKSSGSEELSTIRCRLETKDLWRKFHDLGTEMIITKTGRRMFPSLRVSFSGIQAKEMYYVLMDIVGVDQKRYRYAYHRSSWQVSGKANLPLPSRMYLHHDCPITGAQISNQCISFEKLKLTNNMVDFTEHIMLKSMHKYQPRIHIVKKSASTPVQGPVNLNEELHRTFIFPECAFIAVTAYQNQLITKLKIDSNPFAKGFRDSSRLTDYERHGKDEIERLLLHNTRCPHLSLANILGAEQKAIRKKRETVLFQNWSLLQTMSSAPQSLSVTVSPILGQPTFVNSLLRRQSLTSLLKPNLILQSHKLPFSVNYQQQYKLRNLQNVCKFCSTSSCSSDDRHSPLKRSICRHHPYVRTTDKNNTNDEIAVGVFCQKN